MPAGIREYIERRSPLINSCLEALLPRSVLGGADDLNEAISYAVLSGGRRMRPVLTLLASDVCGGASGPALPVACAVEFVHAASLAVDDLPSMDDAGLRRGSATVHVAFGQGVTILAALSLLNEAYRIFGDVPGLLARAVREIGVNGMIGGQAADVCNARGRARMEKTTSLMRLTMAAGASAAGASAADADVLIGFGDALGEAYQISDDIADRYFSEYELGKTASQDERLQRQTTAAELGYEAAFELADSLIETACGDLRAHFGNSVPADLLAEFARSIPARVMVPK